MDQASSLTAAGSEHRRAARTNMFIAAAAEVEGRVHPVRVRNMSQTGALLEGSELRQGARLVLKRGECSAAGWVVWSDGNRCGIAFTDLVSVPAWMGRPVPNAGEGQKRVDAIQAQIRSGAVPVAVAEPARAEVSAQDLQHRLSEELVHLKRIIDEVGEALTSEPVVMERHTENMQLFVIVSQTLGHLARLLNAPDPAQAVGHIGKEALRRRLSRGGE